MTHNALANALALVLAALTLSVLPSTSLLAGMCVDACECFAPYLNEKARAKGSASAEVCKGKGGVMRYCCEYDPRTGPLTTTRDPNPCSHMGPDYEYDAKKGCVKKPPPKGGAAPAPQEAKKPIKPFGRVNSGCAKNNVDIYDSPVEPRKVTGMMRGGTPGKITERHPHGWVKIAGYGWIANDHFGKCQ